MYINYRIKQNMANLSYFDPTELWQNVTNPGLFKAFQPSLKSQI